MQSFRSFINNQLSEALVTFGGKAYPKSGNVVIMAGGASSGKGFVKNKLLGIEGKTFDVDEIKTQMLKNDKLRYELHNDLTLMVKAGTLDKVPDLSDPNLMKDPKIVSALHATAERLGIAKKAQNAFFSTLLPGNDNLPNIIFDVTMKNITKLHNLSVLLTKHGYEKRNIHLVWVVNDIKVAISQNADRKRTVPADILLDTHEGAARTMADLLSMSNDLKQYMDGDIWIVPNKKDVNSRFVKNPDGKKGNGYFIFADKFLLKKAGHPVDISVMTKSLDSEVGTLLKNITDYVPKGTFKI